MFAVVGLALFGLTATARAADRVDFVRDVQPILETYCVACHTSDDPQGGLVMRSHDALMLGGDSGAAITPGSAGSSRLWLMAAGKLEPVMPPDDAVGPNEDELAVLAAWIDQGADGPEGDSPMRRNLRVPEIAPVDGVALPITALAIDPSTDSRIVASFGDVRWVTPDGTVTGRLPPQPGKVNSLRVGPDGRQLSVASGVTGLYGRVAVYDLDDQRLIHELIGHDDIVQMAIFSPDGRWIASASYDHQIILWDAHSGAAIRTLRGHNGAVYSIAFSPDSSLLISGSADETVKVWDVESGRRLDTMSQPEGEVHAVAVTADGRFVLAGSGDNRLRVWRLESTTSERINPLLASRYVDESPPTHLAITADGSRLVIVSEAGNVKVFSTDDWNQQAVLTPLGETANDLAISVDGAGLLVSLASGNVVTRDLPSATAHGGGDRPADSAIDPDPIYLDVGPLRPIDESELRSQVTAETLPDERSTGPAESGSPSINTPLALPRGAEVSGVIGRPGEEDWFAFEADAGEMWVIETDTTGLDSRLDSVVEIRDSDGAPVTRVRLQAVRDSYFTFRGKNSSQTNDFRVFAWEEMTVGEYFYSGGEVTRLWLYPRGADSGFDVFPGMGSRWTYFGTTAATHALGDPAYIVRPLTSGEPAPANGLPVFDIPYLNDDHPHQTRGKDSYLLFKAPAADRYLIRLRDTRGEGGDGYRYRLRLRPATPGFIPKLPPINAGLRSGAGREVMLMVDRIDGFDGEVTFDIDELPPGVTSSFPVTVQAGQRFAVATIFVQPDAEPWDGEVEPKVRAHAIVDRRRVEREVGSAGKLKWQERGEAILTIHADDDRGEASPLGRDSVVKIRRGETISLIVRADRQEGFTTQIPLGNEQSGRNLPFGCYVDNIGLNGLLIRERESERRFFITADAVTEPGRRTFFLTGAIDGGLTTEPITMEVLP